MAYPTSQRIQFNNFKGIRTRNGIATAGTISATVCQNIDFVPSGYDAGICITTSKGNVKVCEYDGFDLIKGFEFETETGKRLLLYAVNETKGQLIEYNLEDEEFEDTPIIDDLTPERQANAITMIDNAFNTFIFTNGIEYYAWCPDGTTVLQQLTPQYEDDNGNTIDIKGLAMCEQDGSLVIGSNDGIVIASEKGDITNFDYNVSETATKPWMQRFGKPITAVVTYIDSLLVFTAEDSTVLSGNFSNPTTSGATRQDASLGGCMSFESWCRHDKYIFFYDNIQKNLYYYMQNDIGQKVLGEPIAPEVQKFFNNVNKLQILSFVGDNRSELWLLSNNFKLIFDYYIKEWSERVCQDLTSYFVFDNNVYSTGGSACFKEKAGEIGMYNEVFYPSKYTMQIINMGSFSNMKEMEFQPLLSVITDYNNTFYIDCFIDGKKVKSKYVKSFYNGAIWADDEPLSVDTPLNELWADDEETTGQTFPTENDSIIQQIKGKFISNWYYLQFTLRTSKRGDDFSITNFELKGITQETDTTGRK